VRKLIKRSLVGLVLMGVACFAGIAVICAPTATGQSQTIISPDGQHAFRTFVERDKSDRMRYLHVFIEVLDARGDVVTTLETGASHRMRWSVAWDGMNRIWLNSSDIGTYYWQQQAGGDWEKQSYERGDPITPPFADP
jgi:hypothetical protein